MSARWRATRSARHSGIVETVDTVADVRGSRISAVTSRPFTRTQRSPGFSDNSMSALVVAAMTAARSDGATPASRNATATARYIAPVSR